MMNESTLFESLFSLCLGNIVWNLTIQSEIISRNNYIIPPKITNLILKESKKAFWPKISNVSTITEFSLNDLEKTEFENFMH